jgi:D-amino-acid dehydrogenase
MFNPGSPFYIRPRLNPDLIRWLWRFYRASNQRTVDRVTPLMADFQLLSKSLFREIAEKENLDFGFQESGILMIARKEDTLHEIGILSEKSVQAGMTVHKMSQDAVLKKEPQLSGSVLGGYHFEDDAYLNPGQFIQAMRSRLIEMGISFIADKSVSSFKTGNNSITEIKLDDGQEMPVRNVLIAAGAWSPGLLKKLGLILLLQDGKGYSITFPDPGIRIGSPLILEDVAIGVTPVGADIRVAGMLELSGLDPKPSQKRLELVQKGIEPYFNGVIWPHNKGIVWSGYRPCSADGVPYVGRVSRYSNLSIATGHAMQGMSLGPATGLLVSQILTDQKTSLPVAFLDPERYPLN